MASAIFDVPTETLQEILEHFDYPELLRASHVCKRWRANAFTRPTYWRDIGFGMYRHSRAYRERRHDQELVMQRLSYNTAARNLNIAVLADTMDEFVNAFALMQQHLHRIASLSVEFSHSVAMTLIETTRMILDVQYTLARPMSSLESFKLRFGRETYLGPMDKFLPKSDILRVVHLYNAVIHPVCPESYPSVTTLYFHSVSHTVIPPTLFHLLPRLQTLDVNLTELNFSTPGFYPPAPSTLSALSIAAEAGYVAAFLPAIGSLTSRISLIRWIITSDRDPSLRDVVISRLLDHLGLGGVSCAASGDTTNATLVCTFRSLDADGAGRIRELRFTDTGDEDSTLFDALMRLTRLVELRLGVQDKDLVNRAVGARHCRNMIFTVPSHEWRTMRFWIAAADTVAHTDLDDDHEPDADSDSDDEENPDSESEEGSNSDSASSDDSNQLERITIEAQYTWPPPEIHARDILAFTQPFVPQGRRCRLDLVGFRTVHNAEALQAKFDVTIKSVKVAH